MLLIALLRGLEFAHHLQTVADLEEDAAALWLHFQHVYVDGASSAVFFLLKQVGGFLVKFFRHHVFMIIPPAAASESQDHDDRQGQEDAARHRRTRLFLESPLFLFLRHAGLFLRHGIGTFFRGAVLFKVWHLWSLLHYMRIQLVLF
jgi:hypothetical protein